MIETTGQRIKRLRLGANMTQDQFAEAINANRVTVARYEKDAFMPSSDALLRIAKVFNVTTDYMLGKTSPDDKGDIDIKFAVFGDPNVTDAQFEEVKQFARFIRERDRK